MQITKGKRARARKVVIYGPEGVGKSSLAAAFPNPVFIDTEGSTDEMDVARLEKPSSWTMLLNQLSWLKANPNTCRTLVIDTIDWAEQLAVEAICATHGKKGIEDFNYGNGYVYAKEEIGRFLNKLQELIEVGINVVLAAHAQIRKFEQPDEMGAYDRYELKLGKKTSSQTAPLVKEWADMVLFCNYKTVVVTDSKSNKSKAQGGQRMMYTQHHPAWDAKNRYGLPFELPLDYGAIAHIFEQPAATEVSTQATSQAIPPTPPVVSSPVQSAQSQPTQQPHQTTQTPVDVTGVPKQLADLMLASNVTKAEIQQAVGEKGFFPQDMPVENYPIDFIDQMLVPQWEKVLMHIENDRALPY